MIDKLLERLAGTSLEFVLVGGYAAMSHGCSLVTQDVDICIEFSESNIFTLDETLNDLNLYHRFTPQKRPFKAEKDYSTALKNLYLMTDLGPLDCLSEIIGLGPFSSVKEQSTLLELPWGKIRLLQLDALIKSKSELNRPRDILAVEELKFIRSKKQM